MPELERGGHPVTSTRSAVHKTREPPLPTLMWHLITFSRINPSLYITYEDRTAGMGAMARTYVTTASEIRMAIVVTENSPIIAERTERTPTGKRTRGILARIIVEGEYGTSSWPL